MSGASFTRAPRRSSRESTKIFRMRTPRAASVRTTSRASAGVVTACRPHQPASSVNRGFGPPPGEPTPGDTR